MVRVTGNRTACDSQFDADLADFLPFSRHSVTVRYRVLNIFTELKSCDSGLFRSVFRTFLFLAIQI